LFHRHGAKLQELPEDSGFEEGWLALLLVKRKVTI